MNCRRDACRHRSITSTSRNKSTRLCKASAWQASKSEDTSKSSGKKSRHLNDGCVENVEDELRRDADGEHEQRDRNDDPLLASPQIRKPAATFRERTAEERLHRAHKHDCCDQKTDRGD